MQLYRITSVTFGHIYSTKEPTKIEKIFFWSMAVFAVIMFFYLICSFPKSAHADNDQEPGQTARSVLPYPVRYPPDSTKPPGASLAIGPGALQNQGLGGLPYQNFAIGLNALNGTLGTAGNSLVGVQNFALGYQACGKVTTGFQNTCIGSGAGKNITSAGNTILIGTGAGSGLTTTALNNYDIIIDSSNPASPCTTCTTSILIGSGTGALNTVGSTIVGYNAALHDTFGGSGQTIIGANVGLNRLGSANTQSNIILIGGNTTTGIISDTATTSTVNAIGVGTGYPGTGDTTVGYNALGSNTIDSAFQTAFGFNSLNLSNVANAQNSAFGYASCAAVTNGKNNICFGYNSGAATLATGSGNILLGSGTDTLASNTSNEINIGGLVFYNNSSTAAPVISACGTSPAIDANANNRSGTVTVGTVSATSCTITFAGSGYTTWNHCRISSQAASVASLAYSYTKTVITISGTSLIGDVFDYDCDGV